MSWKTLAPRIGVLLLLLAVPAAAQKKGGKAPPPPPPPAKTTEIEFKLPFWTSYIERGVVLGNLPHFQPQLGVTIRSPRGSAVTIGFLTTVELVKPADSTRFGFADSLKRPNLVEFRPSLTLAQGFANGQVMVDAGGFYRMFPNNAGITKAASYGGVTAGLGFPKAPLVTRFGFAYDVGTIEGPRGDAEVMLPLTVAPGAALLLGARAGWAFNQKVNGGPAVFQRFARSGFTNLDLVTGLNLTIAGAKVQPRVEFIYARDSSAVGTTIPYAQRKYLWLARFGTSIAIGGSFPKAPPPPPPPPAKGGKAPAKPAAKQP